MIASLWQDVRYAFASLRKARGYASASILTLTVGVGVAGAAYGVADAVLFKPLPFPSSDRLMLLHESTPRVPDMYASYPNFLDWRAQSSSFEALGAYRPIQVNVSWAEGTERVPAVMASADLFRVLQTVPMRGRFFTGDDDRPGGEPVVVLDHGLWTRRFGADPSIVGKPMMIGGKSFVIIGVMPASFRLPAVTSGLWLPLGQWADDEEISQRSSHPDLVAIGRLAPGASLERARNEMAGIARRLEDQYPESNSDHGIGVVGWRDSVVAPIRRILLIVVTAAALVLLIAWVNIGNLMVAQSMSRRTELSARAALGASRGRLVRQMLAENGLVAIFGLVLGLIVASVVVRLIVATAGSQFPRLDEAGVGIRVVLAVGAVVVALGLALSLGPALQAVRGDLARELTRGETGTISNRGQHLLRGALIVQETALALAVLACTGLLLVSFVRLVRADPGFDADGVMSAALSFSGSRYETPESQARFAEELEARLASQPGVSGAAVVYPLPLAGGSWRKSYSIEGQEEPAPGEHYVASFQVASPAYFDVLGIELRLGRTFSRHDGPGAPLVAVVDETLAKQRWPGENAVGKRLKLNGSPSADEPWLEVIGVVRSVRNAGIDQEPEPTIYTPFAQQASPALYAVARSARPEVFAVADLRNEIASLDRTLPVDRVRTLASYLERGRSQSRLALLLMAGFAIATVCLAGVGTYSVMAERTKERGREIGVRIALGARSDQVTRLMMSQSARLWIPGLIIGLAIALAVAGPLSPALYRTDPRDPAVLGLVTLGLALIALVASYLPLWRLLKTDATAVLKQ